MLIVVMFHYLTELFVLMKKFDFRNLLKGKWALLPAIWMLAWPTMLEQLLQTAVQYIDAAWWGTWAPRPPRRSA